MPWKYSVEKVHVIVVPKDEIALVEAVAGAPIPAGRRFGKVVDCNNFQDARAFLQNGGSRGQQLAVLLSGSYRINTKLFKVITSSDARNEGLNSDTFHILKIGANNIGIVTIADGKPLDEGEIAAPIVSGHSAFTDPQAFIDNGGYRGLQQEVLRAGDYVMNPWFAHVELAEMTYIPAAHVGVVISAVGKTGGDVSGEEFTHGEIVPEGYKGIWNTPLNPGMHAINTAVNTVELVQTSKLPLNWSAEIGAHGLDKALGTINVISRDGFTIPIEVQQVINIPYTVAARVIAQFESVEMLITSLLAEMVSNFFRNAVQALDAKDFLDNRQKIQLDAEAYITKELAKFDIRGVNTFISRITPPPQLVKILQDRKLAEEGIATTQQEQALEEARQQCARASALADAQQSLVNAEQAVEIAKFNASSAEAAADGAKRVRIKNAEADAESSIKTAQGITAIADATAHKTSVEGNAEAEVIRKKTEATSKESYVAIEVAHALAGSNLRLVPEISMGGDSSNGVISALLGSLAIQNITGKTVPEAAKSASAGTALLSNKTDA